MKGLLLITLLLFAQLAGAQKSPDTLDGCSVRLAKIEKAGTSVTEDEFDLFLSLVNPFCLSSVEFSEWVNELLYSTVIRMPEKFLVAFQKQDRKTQKNIIEELKSPIHDGIDLNKAFKAIKTCKRKLAVKDEVLEAIGDAGSKMGLELQ